MQKNKHMETKTYDTRKPMVKEKKIKEEIRKYHETNENSKWHFSKSMGCSKSNLKRKAYSDTGLPQETRKILNNLIYHLNELEQGEEMRRKVRRKIRMDINKRDKIH